MSSTRTQIRQEAAARLGSLTYPYPSTAASGSTTTAVVNELVDSVESEFLAQGDWAYFLTPAGNLGEVRRVQSYSPSTGTLTFNRALGTAVASTHTFELHSWFDPRIWHDCINRALRNTPRLRREEITILDNDTQYSLASYTWMTKQNQIKRLLLRYGSTASEYRWVEIPSSRWWVGIDDDVLTLYLTEGFTTNSSLALFFEAIGPYAELSTDASTTDCNLDWIVFGTLRQAYDVYGKLIDEGGKRTVLIDRDDVIRRHQQLTREHAPKINPVLRLPPPGHA